MKLLITGSNGFVGKPLSRKVLSLDIDVTTAVRTASSAAIGNEVIIGEINHQTNWQQSLSGVDAVVHLAARVHIMHDNNSDPLSRFREVNRDGTIRLAAEAARNGVKRFIYISSIKVNGEENLQPYTELDKPKTNDPYGISKLEAENELRRLADDTEMEVVIIRPPLIYGPAVRANFLRLIKLVDIGLPLPLGCIDNRRSMIYIGNLIDIIIKCLEHPKAAGETFLVSDGYDVSTPELIRLIADSMGKQCWLLPVPKSVLNFFGKITSKSAEVQRLCGSLRVNCNKIKQTIDWNPPFTTKAGIQKTVDWYITLSDKK